MRKPEDIKISPEKLADRYVKSEVYLVKDKLTVMKAACEFIANEMVSNPIVREKLLELFHQIATIRTEPTKKGRKEIDVYDDNFKVKRIVNRKICNISGSQWMRILNCMKKGLIVLRIHIPGEEKTERNQFLKCLRLRYCAQGPPEKKTKLQQQWDILRSEALRIMLKRIRPELEETLKERLTDLAHQSITKYCYEQLRAKLFQGPWGYASGNVFGVITEEKAEGRLKIACCDENGFHVGSLDL